MTVALPIVSSADLKEIGAHTEPVSNVATPPTTSPGEDAEREAPPCGEFEDLIASAEDPGIRAHALLATARCALEVRCAAHLSRLLTGHPVDRKPFVEVVQQAQNRLDRAESQIQRLSQDFDEDVRERFEDRLEMLRAFAEMFSALAQADGSTEASERLTGACIELAVYVDDPSPGIVESAKLWQGVAYRLAGKPDRALNLLPASPPSASRGRIDLLMRLERCRALADQGMFIAAISLNLRIGARAEEWLRSEGEETRTLGAEGARLIRAEILQQWAEELRQQGRPDRAEAADQQAKDLLGDATFPPDASRWLTLKHSIRLSKWAVPRARVTTTQAAEGSR